MRLRFSVTDDGTPSASLSESLTIAVTAVNDAPARIAGNVSPLTVVEDAGTTSLGLAGLAYGPGGGVDEAGQTLSYAVTVVPASTLGLVLLANGTTVVAAGPYSLTDIQGMQFRPAVYVLKPLVTILILLLAVAASPKPTKQYRLLIIGGLALSCVGDVLLMLPNGMFVQGLAACRPLRLVVLIPFSYFIFCF